MIVLTVLSYNGEPSGGLSASFDEIGGSIGRAENNQLVLPDPERTISRVHARMVFRAGGYAIVDNGSNPISVNGTLLGSGREHPIAAGDQVQIGGYLLAASAGAGAAEDDDPFADLFGAAAHSPATPPPAVTAAWPAPASAPARAPQGHSWPAPSHAPAVPAWSAPAAPSPAGMAQIPDDWDPFAIDPVDVPARSPAAAGGGSAAMDFGGPAGGDSLDDLFGLGGAATGVDPLGAAPAQALLMQANTASHADPLQSLSRPASVAAASVADHFSELNTPMPLPPASPPRALPARVSPFSSSPAPAHAPAAPPAMPAAALPAGAVFSWDEPPRDGRVVTLPGVRRAAVAAPPAPPTAEPARAAARHAQPASAGGDELLAALLDGLATPGLRIDRLTPELMLLLGQLLRESTRGAVELLVARAALKREMRAEMTMIVARENNPLKFSPSAEVALQHLLGPLAPGFMAPAPALRDAFDDLRAHQLGVMAGMRAALEGVLQRFDPQQLEGKLTRRSAITNLIPAARKARLWESFQELFAQLSSEAQDDFDELFGKAFLRAYEAQLDRLQAEPGPR